jgi:hypothetical protein
VKFGPIFSETQFFLKKRSFFSFSTKFEQITIAQQWLFPCLMRPSRPGDKETDAIYSREEERSSISDNGNRKKRKKMCKINPKSPP